MLETQCDLEALPPQAGPAPAGQRFNQGLPRPLGLGKHGNMIQNSLNVTLLGITKTAFLRCNTPERINFVWKVTVSAIQRYHLRGIIKLTLGRHSSVRASALDGVGDNCTSCSNCQGAGGCRQGSPVAVCFDRKVEVSTPCGHLFCQQCLELWTSEDETHAEQAAMETSCPSFRKKFRERITSSN